MPEIVRIDDGSETNTGLTGLSTKDIVLSIVLLSVIFFAYKKEYEIAIIIIALYELFVRLGVGHEN